MPFPHCRVEWKNLLPSTVTIELQSVHQEQQTNMQKPSHGRIGRSERGSTLIVHYFWICNQSLHPFFQRSQVIASSILIAHSKPWLLGHDVVISHLLRADELKRHRAWEGPKLPQRGRPISCAKTSLLLIITEYLHFII